MLENGVDWASPKGANQVVPGKAGDVGAKETDTESDELSRGSRPVDLFSAPCHEFRV